MENPTYPENVSEIPSITFYAVKENCNKTDSENREGISTSISQEAKLLGPSGFSDILKDLGVDVIW